MRFLLAILLILLTCSATAQTVTLPVAPATSRDYFEIGISGNYRKVYLSEDTSTERAYDENSAYTGSFAYYFREMTALEFSYSRGKNTRYIPSSTISSTTTHRYSLIGADLVFTFGKRGDTFIPYIKAGIAYFDRKSIDYIYTDHINNTVTSAPVEMDSTVVPSVGLGMQVRVLQQLAFKAGVDIWTSGPISKDIEDFDWAARLGISWFL